MIFVFPSFQQRVKSSSTADRLRELASHFSQAESKVQQLEKLRPVYEDYTKLVMSTVPATEKLIADLQEEHESKSRALNDVSFDSTIVGCPSMF